MQMKPVGAGFEATCKQRMREPQEDREERGSVAREEEQVGGRARGGKAVAKNTMMKSEGSSRAGVGGELEDV